MLNLWGKERNIVRLQNVNEKETGGRIQKKLTSCLASSGSERFTSRVDSALIESSLNDDDLSSMLTPAFEFRMKKVNKNKFEGRKSKRKVEKHEKLEKWKWESNGVNETENESRIWTGFIQVLTSLCQGRANCLPIRTRICTYKTCRLQSANSSSSGQNGQFCALDVKNRFSCLE